MNDQTPPPLLPSDAPTPRPARGGLGCFTKGCLITIVVLMLCGIGLGTFGWLLYKSGQAFITDQPVAVRTAEVTDDQYQAVVTKLQPFGQAMADGQSATVELTADDLNTLIARAPQLAPLRGLVFVDVVKGQLVADLSVPVTDSGPSQVFVNARTTLDASFAGGRLALALRRAVPLKGELQGGLLPSLMRNPAFMQSYSQKLTDDTNARLRDLARKDPTVGDALAQLRTVVIRDNVLVVTSVDRPKSPAPVATPANTE